jgi:putative endonuclease
MANNIKIGRLGEEIASRYLINKGYEILDRNYRRKFGEIDIITKKLGKLTFFEIKTFYSDNTNFLKPEDNFTTQKEIKVNKICQFFAIENLELIDEEIGWQIDLMSIIIVPQRKIIIRHYKNV